MRRFDTESYLKLKDEAAKSSHIDVTETEFIKLFVENGGRPEDAKMHANVSKIMGSYVKIGDKMVAVVNRN